MSWTRWGNIARLAGARLPVNGGRPNGWPPRTVSLFALAPTLAHAAESPLSRRDESLLKLGIALGSILIVQAIIPVIKAWINKRTLRATYRSYLLAHVENTLESFGGVGSTHFADTDLPSHADSDWLAFLTEHNLGVPQIFADITSVIDKARTSADYIPSVSYFGLGGNPLASNSPLWTIPGRESQVAVRYFLTQKQVETSLDYQYSGWYFDLIRSTTPTARERWCLGLENVLFDMAQHYKAAIDLAVELTGAIPKTPRQ